MTKLGRLIALGVSLAAWSTAAQAAVATAEVVRESADSVRVAWTGAPSVDIYALAHPHDALGQGKLVAKAASGGAYVLKAGDRERPFLVLVDPRDKRSLETAERAVPLEQGSNFRDLGGYVGAGGKHVRWGRIYRSAGQPLLTAGDVARIQAMGVGQLVDLRSSEERTLAPTRIQGVPYAAVGYAMTDLMAQSGGEMRNGGDVYRRMPTLLAPHLKLVFANLLAGGDAPLVYNCSAGQDRTGFVTAMVLSALGVSYEQIVQDYHLSTTYRRPDWEMPKLEPANTLGNPVAAMFAQYQQRPEWRTPQPLKDAAGRPFLDGAMDEIRERWGSVEAYLEKEVGLSRADIARLRALYLD